MRRFPTADGEAIGLVLEIWENYGRSSPVIYLTEAAQRFIVDNIEAVMVAEVGTSSPSSEEDEEPETDA